MVAAMSNIYRVSVIQRRDNKDNKDNEDNKDKMDDNDTDNKNDYDKKVVKEAMSSLEVAKARHNVRAFTIEKRMISTESDFTTQSERVEDKTCL